MQIGTVTVALGGDTGHTVEKYNVTPSEVAVLQQIHGSDSINNIRILGDVSRTNRAERERLASYYGRPTPEGGFEAPVISKLFPGVAARLYDKFDELELDEDFFAPDSRPKAAPVAEAVPEAVNLHKLGKVALLTKAAEMGVEVSDSNTKAEIIEAIEAAEVNETEVDDSGIEDMNDGLFK